MQEKDRDEYCFLTDKLDEVIWAIKGKCNDIDCDEYLYKDLLKKRYMPVLEHNFSCMKKLKKEKETILRLLSRYKYKKYRFMKCNVCKKYLDKLDEKNKIVSFTRPINENKKISYQWEGVWAHKKCSSRVKIPAGWKRS